MLVLSVAQSGTGAAQGARRRRVGDPANGKAVFAFGNTSCTNCHGLEGQGGWGPDLAGRRITYDQAVAAIRNPMWRMPAFVPSQLSDKEILDMVAYWNTLPVAPAIGKWRNEAPANGPRAQQLAVNIIGCGQCHGNTMSTPRHGAAGMNADFEWFKKQVYNHATRDAGTVEAARWRRTSEDARPRADGQFLAEAAAGIPAPGNLDVDERAGNGGADLWRGSPAGQRRRAGTTYTLDVENEGLKDKGVAAEDVTISLVLPPGTKGGVGDRERDIRAPSETRRPMPTWPCGAFPKLAAHEHQNFTITLAGTAAGDAVPRGTVAYAKPTAKADAVVNFALQRPGGRGRGAAQ